MKMMTTWSAKPGAVREAVQRFLAGQATPVAGVTMLGRWHAVDCSGGYTLYETNDAAAMYEGAAKWSELLDIESEVVIEDAEAGAAMAKVFGK